MSNDDLSLFQQVLTSNGFHVTKARLATFQALASLEPQAINDILAKTHGQIDRVSVYRNIELFEKLGIVQRIYVGWKYKLELSDQFIAHHHHLSCLKCGQVVDIQDEQHIDAFIAEVSQRFDFEPRRHQFEIDGYCHNCRSK